MRRRPRDARQHLLWGRPLIIAILEGVLCLAFVIAIYLVAEHDAATDTRTRLLAFSAVIIANLSLIFFARSSGRRVWDHIVAGNRSLWLIAAGTALAYAAVVSIPALRDMFRLSEISSSDAMLLGGGTLALWGALAILSFMRAAADWRMRPRD